MTQTEPVKGSGLLGTIHGHVTEQANQRFSCGFFFSFPYQKFAFLDQVMTGPRWKDAHVGRRAGAPYSERNPGPLPRILLGEPPEDLPTAASLN